MAVEKLGRNIDFHRGQYRVRIVIPPRLRPFILKQDGSPRTTLEQGLGGDPRTAKKRSYAILARYNDVLDTADELYRQRQSGLSHDRTRIASSEQVPTCRPQECAPGDDVASETFRPGSLTLADCLARFHQERRTVAEGTKKEHAIAMRMLEGFLGKDKPVSSITRQDMLRYKNALIITPANCQQRFPGLTIPQAIKANSERSVPYPVLHPNTINKKWLSHTNTILSWAKKNLFIDENPCDGIKVDNGSGFHAPSRVAFSRGDIHAIFSNHFFSNPKLYDSRHWALLIALYTGARSSSEIRRIKLSDIYREQGIFVFDLIEATKNAHSKRVVPVHNDLLEIGLLAYVERLVSEGRTRLFWDWEPADKINRWFLRSYKPKVGISDKRKVFHSFRHSMKTELARCGVNRDVSDLITGHKDQSVGGIYISDQSTTMVQSMKEGIERLDFGVMTCLLKK